MSTSCALITTDGTEISGPEITQAYVGEYHDWKRVAIPLPASVHAADIVKFQLDAYDLDGIYWTAIGDAFIAEPAGDNGATLDYVRRGERDLADYVDDDSTGCSGGTNEDGPDGITYTCDGGRVDIAK